jgi:hypothetical protein
MSLASCILATLTLMIALLAPALGQAQGTPSTDILTDDQWTDVESSVERSLAFLASQQQRDGSFPTLPYGQPGVTGLCTLAFLAHGHTPDSEPYGKNIEKAIKYIANCPNGRSTDSQRFSHDWWYGTL